VTGRPALSAAAGAVVIAFSAILVRLAEVSPSTAATFRCLYALPVLGLLAVLERRRHGPRTLRERAPALAAGLFFACDLTAWHYAIDAVGAGLATVLANLQVVLVGLLAWVFLNERPGPRLLVSIPLVLGGVVLISGLIGAGAYGDDPLLGVVFGVLTALSYALFLLVLRKGNTDLRRPAGPLFDATLTSAVLCALGGLALGRLDPLPGPESQVWLITLALTSQVLGWLLISISLPRLPAALTSVILTLQPVGSVVLGVILLAEAPSPVQVAGVAVVVAGVVLATSARGEQHHGDQDEREEDDRDTQAHHEVGLVDVAPHREQEAEAEHGEERRRLDLGAAARALGSPVGYEHRGDDQKGDQTEE
jgi:drug/metabolite transporter (DMT)-like permease